MLKIFKSKKKILIIAVIIVILIFLGIAVFGKKKSPVYEFTAVKRGDVIEEVSATGTVKPADDVDLRFETSGTVEKLYVKEGSFVKQGAYLVKLNTGKLYSQFLQAKATYNQKKAELDKLLAGATAEEIQVAERVVENARVVLDDVKAKADSDLDEKYDDALVYLINASSGVNTALANLENFESKYFQDTSSVSTIFKDKKSVARTAFFGTNGAKTVVTDTIANPTQVNTDNALTTMRATLIKVKDVLDYTREAMSGPTLREDVTTTDQTTIDTDTTNINTALTNVSTGQQAIASQKVTNQTNINSAENTFKKADDDLAELKAVPRDVDINIYNADLDKARASMVELEQKLDDAILKAPIDGAISKIDVRIGETVIAGGNPIVSLISSNNFEIEVDVPETDIGKVHLNDPAIILLDAFPEQSWSAKVVEIEPAETIIESVVYYKVKVIFDKIDERIKSGMSADVTIETNKKENVLFIPQRAVVYKEGKRFARILNNGKVEEKEIETGIKGSNGEIEVVSGLIEEEKVITFIKK